MALENLEPENRIERLLSGADLEPANRLEYFLKQAGSGGSGSVEYDLLVVYENGSDTLTGDYNLVLNKLTNKRPVNALYIAQDAKYSSKWHYNRVVTFETTDSSIIIAFEHDVLIWFPNGTHVWD